MPLYDLLRGIGRLMGRLPSLAGAFLMLALALPGAAQAQAPQLLVQGTLTDRTNNQPIVGVAIRSSSCPYTAYCSPLATTDANGQYTVTAAQLGNAQTGTLYFDGQGYFATTAAYAFSSSSVTVNATLLYGGTLIQGTVTDANTQAPIAGASISFYVFNTGVNGILLSATTDVNGHYALDASQVYEVASTGFTPYSGSVSAAAYLTDSLSTFQVTTPFPMTQNFALTPVSGSAVQGTLTDRTSGLPLAGVAVRTSSCPYTAYCPPLATTDANGQYTVTTAQLGNAQTGTLYFDGQGYFATTAAYAFSSSSVTVNATLLYGGTLIQGTVTDANTQAPIAGASISFYVFNTGVNGILLSATTDVNGHYALDASQVYEVASTGFTPYSGSVSAAAYLTDSLSTFQVATPFPATQNFALVWTGLTHQITLATAPAGLGIQVDGATVVAPQTYAWIPGNVHQLATTSPQAGPGNASYGYGNWSDGGLMAQTLVVPNADATFTANFTESLAYSAESGYGTVGVSPATGTASTPFTFKAVYTDAGNTAPVLISVCIDGSCKTMSLDTGAAAGLHDGSYANGEQYVYSTTLAAGAHHYYFQASNGTSPLILPVTGTLTGPAVGNLSIATTSLPGGNFGTTYSATLAASGGTPPYGWSASLLPAGLGINASTGAITGTPTALGTNGVIVTLSDSTGATYSTTFPVTILMGSQSITFAAAPTITVGGTGSVSATGGASGNAVTFTSTTLAVCTVSGNTVTDLTAGACIIAGNQAGNANYTAAPQVTQTINVVPSGPLAPTSLAFGSEALATASPAQVVTVSNAAATSMRIGPIGISANFAIQSRTCSATLAANSTCTITVVFRPTVAGPLTGTLTVGTLGSVALSGTGMVQLATLTGTPTFGNQQVGTKSALQVFTYTNAGALPITVSTVSLGGANPGQFAISADTCIAIVLAPAASCTFDVGFDPTAAGSKAATLTLRDTTGGAAALSVNLSGTGVAPKVSISGASNYGRVTVPTTATFTLNNTGTGPYLISAITLTSGTHYSIAGGSCAVGVTVNNGSSCTVSVTFTPSGSKVYTSSLSVSGSGIGSGAPTSTATLSLRGN